MKKVLITALLISMAGTAQAGWFKKRIKPLKPVVGYIKTVELSTNTWDKCVKNWKKGVQQEGLLLSCIVAYDGVFTINSIATNGCVVIGDNYFNHKCPSCDKAHIDDWPKTTTEVRGIQKKITMEIYKDGKLVTKTVEHKYPHEKIETKTTTTIRYEKSKEVTRTKCTKESK